LRDEVLREEARPPLAPAFLTVIVPRPEVFLDPVLRDEVLRLDVLRAEVLRADVLRADVLRLDVLRLDVLRAEVFRVPVERLVPVFLRAPVERLAVLRELVFRDVPAFFADVLRDDVLRLVVLRPVEPLFARARAPARLVELFFAELFFAELFFAELFFAELFFAELFFREPELRVDPEREPELREALPPDDREPERDEDRVVAGTARAISALSSSAVSPMVESPHVSSASLPSESLNESAVDGSSVSPIPLQSSWVINDLLSRIARARFPTTFVCNVQRGRQFSCARCSKGKRRVRVVRAQLARAVGDQRLLRDDRVVERERDAVRAREDEREVPPELVFRAVARPPRAPAARTVIRPLPVEREDDDVRPVAALRAVARPPFAPAFRFSAVVPARPPRAPAALTVIVPRPLVLRAEEVLRVEVVLRAVVFRAVVLPAVALRAVLFRAVVLRAVVVRAVVLRATVLRAAVLRAVVLRAPPERDADERDVVDFRDGPLVREVEVFRAGELFRDDVEREDVERGDVERADEPLREPDERDDEPLRADEEDDRDEPEPLERDDFVSPASARCLLTVLAAISFARPVERPCFRSDSLMCSYCRSRFALHDLGIGIEPPTGWVSWPANTIPAKCALYARKLGRDPLLQRLVVDVVLVRVLVRQLVDDRHTLAVRRVDAHERLPLLGQRVLGEDRLDRALGLAGAAVDALLGVDDEDAAGLVDAVHGADVDAGAILDVDARLGDHVRHGGLLYRREQSVDQFLPALEERRLRDDLIESGGMRATQTGGVGVVREAEDRHVGEAVGDVGGIDTRNVGDHEVRGVDAVRRLEPVLGQQRLELPPDEQVDPTQQDRRHGRG
jgi:hypothetical protein